MNMLAVLALVVAWLEGTLIVTALWSRVRSYRDDAALILPLGLIVGLGATSVTFFFASLLSPRPALLAGAIDVFFMFGLLWWLRRSPRQGHGDLSAQKANAAKSPPPHPGRTSWLVLILVFVFVQAAVVATMVGWRAYQAEPFGGWDGWTIWNMHARFMLRAGTNWPELLNATQLNWTHPDYPPLVPASVARLWAWDGDETPFAAALVSTGFAAATVALLVAAVAKLRGRVAAFAGGLLLLGTPFFVTFASNQHADIPLGSFMLAAVLLAALTNRSERPRGCWALAGICTGGAAWTKNEGLLFAVVFAAGAGFYLRRPRSLRSASSFLAGMFVALLPLLYFKLRLAPANDLMSAPLGPRIAQLFDASRHTTILSSLWRDLHGFGEWRVAPWLAMALPFAAWRSRSGFVRTEWLAPSMFGLMLAGYYGVYLLSPQALAWHLDTSLVRLLLQLWPLALFTWCLALPPVSLEARGASRILRLLSHRTLFVALNVVVAAALLFAMSNQRAAYELAVRRIGGAEVSAALTEGWFPIERHGADEWAWSSGTAKVTLHVDSPEAVGPLTLRFGLRSANDARTVVVRERSRVLWQGPVTGDRVSITIPALRLEPGSTTLDFSTDTPGVAESAEQGGRTLAFALFNLRLK